MLRAVRASLVSAPVLERVTLKLLQLPTTLSPPSRRRMRILRSLADGHHRFGGVEGGFIGKVHGHLGFVHLRGGHLGDVPFLGCILVVGIGALHGFLLKLP